MIALGFSSFLGSSVWRNFIETAPAFVAVVSITRILAITLEIKSLSAVWSSSKNYLRARKLLRERLSSDDERMAGEVTKAVMELRSASDPNKTPLDWEEGHQSRGEDVPLAHESGGGEKS